jgi:hypothetical protein
MRHPHTAHLASAGARHRYHNLRLGVHRLIRLHWIHKYLLIHNGLRLSNDDLRGGGPLDGLRGGKVDFAYDGCGRRGLGGDGFRLWPAVCVCV